MNIIINSLTEPNFILILITGLLVGAASGYLGSFMVLKRMSLVGDALSHVALPGMAIALLFGINPMIGAIFALSLAIIGIWYLGEHSDVYPEALVGVFFTASLAIGILVTPEPELLEALFGNLEKVGTVDAMVTGIVALAIFGITNMISEQLLLGVVSEDLARSTGIKVQLINLVYLLLVGLVVALGVKFVGTLLTGALVIVPAVAAMNFSQSMKHFHLFSAILGTGSVLFGIVLAQALGVSAGPIIVLMSISFFCLSYLFKK